MTTIVSATSVLDRSPGVAQSSHSGQYLGGFLSGGYLWQLKSWVLGPFASVQYSYLDEDGFQESGAGNADLKVQDRQTQLLISELGLRLAYVLKQESFSIIPELSLAWNYAFDIDDRTITASYAGAPNATFSRPGRRCPRMV